MATREIHDAQGQYSGYARFGANGAFQGTYGGQVRMGGRLRRGASYVQNTYTTIGMRQGRRARG